MNNDLLLKTIDQCLAEIRASYTELPIERVAPPAATAESASERWILAALYAGHKTPVIVFAKPVFTVAQHKRIFRHLVVCRMIRPVGQLTSTDLDGCSEDELAILRAAIHTYPGTNPNLDEHLSVCGGSRD